MGEPADGGDALLATGARIGDFQIHGFLGEGAMGQVYLAQDTRLGRRVALKFIKRSVMPDGGAERFLEEARATASFSHPHIVTLHAVGEHEGRPYLALEYIDGESLRACLAAGPLPAREALRYCRAVADAIAEAHRRGLVHADLKPENILVPRDGRVRVVDFGVSKLAGSVANAASGTPAYMAPERWSGAPPTGAIDVWALGVTLHELIVGRHPIADAELLHLAFAADTLELPHLPAVPWAQLVRDCLALDPDARPTAEELLGQLDELIATLDATTSDATTTAPTITAPAPASTTPAPGARPSIAEPTADEIRLLRGILLALIDPDGTRLPLVRRDLLDSVPAGSREAVDRLLDRLVDRRLVVARGDLETNDTTLEFSRDALATAWPQLARWLDESYAPHLRPAFSARHADASRDPGAAPALGDRTALLEQHHEELAGRAPLRAAMPAGRAARSSALTGGERRFLCVVLLGPAPEPAAAAEPPAAPAEAPAPAADTLRRAIKPYSGRLEQLPDGSTLVVLEPDRQVATDQAAQAARCALALRALARGRPMALAMGRAESTRKHPGGDAIDRAARLLSHSSPASAIALDEVIAGLLDARFDVVEGEAGLLLRGERALSQGARTLLGRPTSCVGRDWELNALAGILDECIDEQKARVAVVTAAAGMGKSRLAAELVSRIRQRPEPVAIWSGRGDSLQTGSTLDLLAQALRGALGIHGGEPLLERRDKLRARVAEHVAAAEQKRVTEFLGELIGTPFPGDGDDGAQLRAARQDARLMSEQMRRAWMDFLQAETAAHPVLLLLEDLQWGDFGTVRFIDTALRDRSKQPWMVLALARPEVFEVFPKLWAERQHVQEIRLKELGRKAGERLVRQVLGDSVSTETVERLVKQADGNTFYLEELIRAVAEGKDRALPETVLAMVETRLGRLSLEARRVLRAASVFGEICWESGVTLLLGGAMGSASVNEWLARLVEHEMLVVRSDSRFPDERELAFRHALLREGAYATLTEQDKRLGHRLAGEWLERRGEQNPMVLAGHFERGGDGARAASYYLRAAEQAFHIFDLQAAMTRASLGLGCTPPPELRLALLGIRCEASGFGLQFLSLTVADAEELMRSAPQGSVPWVQAVLAYISGTLVAGRTDELLATIEQLWEVDPAPAAVARLAFVLLNGLCILDGFGQLPQASVLEEQFSAIVRAAGDREPIALCWWNIAAGLRTAYAHEDPWSALQHGNAIQPIFDVIGGEIIFLNMQLCRGLNLWFLGRSELAERTLAVISAADEALGVASSLRRFGLAWLRADRGALPEARALAAQLADYGRAHHLPLEEARGRWVLAEVLRRMGDLDGADRELQIALGIAVPLEHPGVLGSLSALRLAQGRVEDAIAAADEAVSLCTSMGSCGIFRGAFVRLAHAEALRAAGALTAARIAIAEARARLLATASKIPDPAYRQSFLDDVPENARTLALALAWLGEP